MLKVKPDLGHLDMHQVLFRILVIGHGSAPAMMEIYG